MNPRTLVPAAALVAVSLFASLLVSLAFLGRYLEEKTVLDALGPSLASTDPAVAATALELLKGSIPPSRYQSIEKALTRRIWAKAAAKWFNSGLSRDSLRKLHQEIELTIGSHPRWARQFEGIEEHQRKVALNQLSSWIERDEKEDDRARSLRAGLEALKEGRCGPALDVFQKAPGAGDAGSTAAFGRHLSEVCFLGRAGLWPPPHRVAKARAAHRG